jgi:hypothetical protein
MEHFVVLALASFVGTSCALLAAYFLVGFKNRVPLQVLSAEQSSRLQRAKLIAAGVFAAIVAIIVYLISIGELNAALGGIAGVISLLILAFGVRTVRHV